MYTFLVVTPSFNQARYIKQTINSVLGQKGVRVKYFVADGGSTDKTPQLLARYADSLKFISKKDKGQTDAINKGISHFSKLKLDPKKTIFAYINSDDFFKPDTFMKVAAAFEDQPHKMWLIGNCEILTQPKSIVHHLLETVWKRVFRIFFASWTLGVLNPVCQPATFIRWSAVKKIGLFDQKLKFVMDYDYWLKLQRKFGSPIYINQNLATFRIHQQAKGSTSFKDQFTEQLIVAKRHKIPSWQLVLHRLHNILTVTGYQFFKK